MEGVSGDMVGAQVEQVDDVMQRVAGGGWHLHSGRWLNCDACERLSVYAPADGRFLGAVHECAPAQIDALLAAAGEAQRAWANVPLQERAAVLFRAADVLAAWVDPFAEVLSAEICKRLSDSREEILRSADLIRHTAEEGKRLAGEALFGDAFPGYKRGKLGLTLRAPLGVVLAIPPFNYPVNLAVSKIAPALVAGNAVMLKPPSKGVISGHILTEVFVQAGLPGALLQVAPGRGGVIGDYLVMHPRVNMISFTGSTTVGEAIAQKAGMIPVTLELGGKDAAIVLHDADLDLAVKEIVGGAFAYSGQRCTAVKRVLVSEGVADTFVERLVAAVHGLSVGLPAADAVITPLISDQATDYVQELVRDAVDKGAKCLCGNERHGNLLTPAVIDHVTQAMRLAWEEPFGPVLPVIRVPNAAEAVRIANASDYGLQAAIFTRDVDAALQIAQALEVGTVQINGKTGRGPDHFPFVGTKGSGMGAQGIRYSIESMTRIKSIIFNQRAPDDLTRLA